MAEQTSIGGVGELLQEVFAREDGPRRVLEFLLGAAMREEVREHLGGAAPHERSAGRSGHREQHEETQSHRVSLAGSFRRGRDGGASRGQRRRGASPSRRHRRWSSPR